MQALYAQLLVGLINGSFYALLSLGLAVIFGMLNIINFAHGALYMMGAFCAYFLLSIAGIGYWPARPPMPRPGPRKPPWFRLPSPIPGRLMTGRSCPTHRPPPPRQTGGP